MGKLNTSDFSKEELELYEEAERINKILDEFSDEQLEVIRLIAATTAERVIEKTVYRLFEMVRKMEYLDYGFETHAFLYGLKSDTHEEQEYVQALSDRLGGFY